MKNDDLFSHDGLFQIGEVSKCCEVDRQTILFYEKMGLIEPSAKNESSGYRYYSVEAVTQLVEILQLKQSGFSLAEIRNYISSGSAAAQSVIAVMEKKIQALKRGMEEAKAISVEKGNYTVAKLLTPKMVCYKKEYFCRNVDEAIENVYKTIGEVISFGFPLSANSGSFAEFSEQNGDDVKLSDFGMRVFVPVKTTTDLPGCVKIPEQAAISVCHRGDYTQIGKAYHAIWEYVEQHNLVAEGTIREYYLDSRREYTEEQDRYVTRVVLPIKSSTFDKQKQSC